MPDGLWDKSSLREEVENRCLDSTDREDEDEVLKSMIDDCDGDYSSEDDAKMKIVILATKERKSK